MAIDGGLIAIGSPGKRFDEFGNGAASVSVETAAGWELQPRLKPRFFQEDALDGHIVEVEGGRIAAAALNAASGLRADVRGAFCGPWQRSHNAGGPPQSGAWQVMAMDLVGDLLVTAHGSHVRTERLVCTWGETSCDPNNETVLGLTVRLLAKGSAVLGDDDFAFDVIQLPPSVAGFLLLGPNAGFVPFGSCAGELCVAAPIARSTTQLLQCGSNGTLGIDIDLDPLPGTVGGGPVLPGDPWHFQSWSRNPSGQQPFTFSNAVSVLFG